MRPILRSPSERTATVIAVLGLGALGFAPLFGGPGYEAALAAGVLLPSLAAVATALDVIRAPETDASGAWTGTEPFDAFCRGLASGAWLAVVGFVIAWVHGVRVGFCDPVEGAELFALGPGAGAVLGGVWGATVGFVAQGRASRDGKLPSRRVVIALALAAPLGGIVVSFVRFYTSPMVFAFDPFFGFFAGTLYDSVITGLGRLVTYRAGSVATLVATGALSFALGRSESRRKPRLGAVLLGIAAGAASIVHAAHGVALGHYQTARSIREALGQSITGGRCELVYPTGTPAVEARALARECDGHVAQLERLLGVHGPDRITAFVFASPDQKGYLMGAAGTYIAKPWRHEIYVQRAGYPHPVMRHELAHVIAGAFGQGPFRVAGPLGGIVPDPGRIEGVAVAAAPHDEELSLAEWAKAMKTLGLLPPLARVFKLSFLGEPSSRAYVVAGAFIEWLSHEPGGLRAVRRWYGGASVERATGRSLADLERDWSRSLDGLVVGSDVLEVARARFDQPAIFGRRCPHVVDRIAGDAGAALGQLDTARARKLYQQLLALDPHDFGARLGLSTCSLREGKIPEARALLESAATDPALGKAVRARAVETLGDLALETGSGAEARRRYDDVAAVVVDADRLRTLDVKRYAADDRTRAGIIEHLLGDPTKGRDAALAAATLGAWAEREPKLGMADYLLARTYLTEGRFDLAAKSLERALGKELPLASVVREAYRLRVVLACALEDAPGALAAHAAWSKLDGPRAPEIREMADLLERCTGTRPEVRAATSAGSGTLSPAAPGSASPLPDPTTSSPSAPSSSSTPSASPASCPDGMALVPASETWIGSKRGSGAEDEWPRYRTRLAAYCVDRTEVTVGAYDVCVSSGKCTPPGTYHVTCTFHGHGPDYPVNCVDWRQATAYCAAHDARLPTEAEWEHAASGGDDRLYSWGSEPPDGRTCWKSNGACPVGKYPAGAFGLLDMTGNVWEWTSDAYGDYPFPPMESPTRAYRGGSWSRRFEKWMRLQLRNRGEPSFQGAHLGFRCVRNADGAECPFDRASDGTCLQGVLTADCRPGKAWNGERCAPTNAHGETESGCGEGHHFVPGHGCQFDTAVDEPDRPPPDLAAVRRTRSPTMDADCQKFQPARPVAYRFEGGSHEARNAVEHGLGCKNRDVGVGWNSGCCP